MSSSRSTDAQLVAQVLAGDRNAFTPLVERYGDEVYQCIFRITADEGMAHELTQETFIRAFKYLYSFHPEKSFKPWLLRIAGNATRSRLKKEMKVVSLHGDFENDDGDEPVYDQMESVSEALDDINFDGLVDHALRQLSPKYRQAIVLRYKMKYSYEEISEIMDIPLNTVGTRLSRGVERIRQILGEEDRL